MTLLEKAKQTPTTKHPRGKADKLLRERSELTLAWIKGDVTTSQSAAAFGVDSRSLQGRLSGNLFAGIRAGMIKAEMVPEVSE